MKYSDEQVNTRKELQSTPTKKYELRTLKLCGVKQRRMEERHDTYFWGLNNIWAYTEKDVQK